MDGKCIGTMSPKLKKNWDALRDVGDVLKEHHEELGDVEKELESRGSLFKIRLRRALSIPKGEHIQVIDGEVFTMTDDEYKLDRLKKFFDETIDKLDPSAVIAIGGKEVLRKRTVDVVEKAVQEGVPFDEALHDAMRSTIKEAKKVMG